MKKAIQFSVLIILITTLFGCNQNLKKNASYQNTDKSIPTTTIEPLIITDTVRWDTDDPAIWIHPTNPSKSLVIGTDKHKDGALYAFNLKGKIVKVSTALNRPNNVDIAYGFPFKGELIDIAAVTERLNQRIRIFKLPELKPIDQGDLVVFNGDTVRAPMGIALYKRKRDNSFFVFVSGKSGPEEEYIGQYLLNCVDENKIELTPVREFGNYSGKQEIEAIAVDDDLGYVYYSDETVGVRKYHADPEKPGANRELAIFATEGFTRDHEGISIYKKTDKTGYILVSDQQANQFWIFPREGTAENPHDHEPTKIIKTSTKDSDGSEVTNIPLPGFPLGLFVAMSDDKTFQYYSWEDIAGDSLK